MSRPFLLRMLAHRAELARTGGSANARRGGRNRRSETGASAVELALVAPLFVLLILGVIEFGSMFWNLSSLQTTVSAAVRTAGTQSRVDNYQLDVRDIAQVGLRGRNVTPVSLVIYRADPDTGRPTDIAASTKDYMQCSANCYKFTWNSTTKAFVASGSTSWPAADQKACGPAASTDFLGVWVEVLNNGMVSGKRKMHASGIARLEPVPLSNGQTCQP